MALLLNVDVPDLEQATRFYTAAFGLAAARRLGDGARELTGWPVPVYLLEATAGSRGAGDDTRRYTRHWTPLHADVVVDDVDAALARALAAGAVLERAAADTAWGRIAVIADPFGHGWCLLSFRGAGYDAIARPG